jgi:chorismate synthase
MSRNSIGKNLILTSFGESHGAFIGAVLDGFPAGLEVNFADIQREMNRRRPGQSTITTQRNESDEVQLVSGVFEGKTLGTPIAFLIPNKDAQSNDYLHLKDIYRPGHADLLYDQKYGHRDWRGGGRSSARITAGWVAAGALAKQWLKQYHQIDVTAWVSQIYDVSVDSIETIPGQDAVEHSIVRCPDPVASEKMIKAIQNARLSGDSLGGKITCAIQGIPLGVGEPVFGKLNAVLGNYILRLNAVKGISFGDGFDAASKTGSANNDSWIYNKETGRIGTSSNHAGGIVGGMSTGEPVLMEIAFKPTSTIAAMQSTINSSHELVQLEAAGRHDPCVLPRAVPIVEALCQLAVMDLMLESGSKTTN